MSSPDKVTEDVGQPTLSPEIVEELQKLRRFPRPTQFDYLHLRYLLDSLRAAVDEAPGREGDVLDVFCGARPYEHLLPPGARYVGLDVDHAFGVADVVTREFLPFPDESFDLVLCTEAFQFVQDPVQGIAEIERVLRPGGSVVITHSLAWEYHRDSLEYRFTGPQLAALFEGWQDVKLAESGGRAVAWATQTGRMVNLVEERTIGPVRTGGLRRLPFAAAYLLINAVATMLDRVDRRFGQHALVLPMTIILTARRA
jgi:SAM-dependent methyltransferase